MLGEFARAREESERQRQMLAELGPSVTAMSTSIERARVETLAGDLAGSGARAARRRCVAGRARRALLPIDGRRHARRRPRRVAGRFEEAEAVVETARELADDDDTLSQVLWRTAHWARIARGVRQGRRGHRRAWSERSRSRQSGDDIVLLGDAKSARGEVLWRAGRQDAAEPPLREALALYERKEDRASASRVRLRLEALAAGADPTAVG